MSRELRLRRRIRRVGDRLSRNRAELDALAEVEALDLRGRLRRLVTRALEENAAFLADADLDQDGELEFEELVEAVRDWADEQIELEGLAEWFSDVGLDIAASVAVAVHKGVERRIERRVRRDKALLKRLKKRLRDVD